MRYRREIDGLRALAVLPVILFHAGFTLFSGGFVGVDIFFVISGFLITSLILEEKQGAGFSIARFYERRARRILPSLFVVMAVCLPFAWILLRPSDMARFAQSLIAVPIFLSNVLFWNQSGYFEPDTELNPLLHTWSLAVEEQYYVFFPLLLMLFRREAIRSLAAFLLMGAVISFIVSQWGAVSHPSFAFYLLPTRAWELLIGAILATYMNRQDAKKGMHNETNLIVSQIGSGTGLLLILFAIFSFNNRTPFPGFYALAPTIGAALIIWLADERTLVGRILGSPALVGVGLISYSAYLWHQPIFAFTRYQSSTDPSAWTMIVLAISSLAMGYASWRHIERPFRDRKKIGARSIFVISLLGSALFVVVGGIGTWQKGFDYRLSANEKSIEAFNRYPVSKLYSEHQCFMELNDSFKAFSQSCSKTLSGQPTLMIWGDSYAAALSAGVKAITPNVIQYTASTCPPLPGATIPGRPNCPDINTFVMGEVKRLQPDKLILHANWHTYHEQRADVTIEKTIQYVHTVSPKTKVIVIGSAPQWRPTLPAYLIRKGLKLNGEQSLRLPTYADLALWDQKLAVTTRRAGAEFIPLLPLLCAHQACPVVVRSENGFVPFSWDVGHLTKEGSDLVATKIMPKVDGL